MDHYLHLFCVPFTFVVFYVFLLVYDMITFYESIKLFYVTSDLHIVNVSFCSAIGNPNITLLSQIQSFTLTF